MAPQEREQLEKEFRKFLARLIICAGHPDSAQAVKAIIAKIENYMVEQ